MWHQEITEEEFAHWFENDKATLEAFNFCLKEEEYTTAAFHLPQPYLRVTPQLLYAYLPELATLLLDS